jgi:hypothetical protein
MSADTVQLLELLREAGEEAVTLDELAIVGVRDPAGALRELEDAGHAVQRVPERPDRGPAVTCVRLAPPAPAPAATQRTGMLAAAALGVVLLVLVRALSRRRA